MLLLGALPTEEILMEGIAGTVVAQNLCQLHGKRAKFVLKVEPTHLGGT